MVNVYDAIVVAPGSASHLIIGKPQARTKERSINIGAAVPGSLTHSRLAQGVVYILWGLQRGLKNKKTHSNYGRGYLCDEFIQRCLLRCEKREREDFWAQFLSRFPFIFG